MDKLSVLGFLVLATVLEASGDAIVRMGLYQRSLTPRILLFLGGTVLLFGYGVSLNLAPLAFGRVVRRHPGLLSSPWSDTAPLWAAFASARWLVVDRDQARGWSWRRTLPWSVTQHAYA